MAGSEVYFFISLLSLSTAYTRQNIDANKTTPELLPGTIRSYSGEIHLIRNYLAVSIDHEDTVDLPKNLMVLLEEVNLIIGNLKSINLTVNENDRKLLEEILYTSNIAMDRIKEALKWFPDTDEKDRKERGFINIIGIGLKYLF